MDSISVRTVILTCIVCRICACVADLKKRRAKKA